MNPEQKARILIEKKLAQAGWVIQDYKQLDFRSGEGTPRGQLSPVDHRKVLLLDIKH